MQQYQWFTLANNSPKYAHHFATSANSAPNIPIAYQVLLSSPHFQNIREGAGRCECREHV
ncbi:hypothetical protein BpHYR1_033222 [Brachionus plicatilis]|uniref:Uncharacterized protein n=1 Tax=Brachionus plicatilis TaxID=10195 RepID=A0A3M7T876_BRAPC|nr:hypothetical protein BpHYR1_033222 [Brachionus plicatilis]